MAIYAGLDVSDKTTHVCMVDTNGAVVKRDVVASDPELLAKWLGKHCLGLVRGACRCGSHRDVLSSKGWCTRAWG